MGAAIAGVGPRRLFAEFQDTERGDDTPNPAPHFQNPARHCALLAAFHEFDWSDFGRTAARHRGSTERGRLETVVLPLGRPDLVSVLELHSLQLAFGGRTVPARRVEFPEDIGDPQRDRSCRATCASEHRPHHRLHRKPADRAKKNRPGTQNCP